jgi:cyclic pyranopterin phosphate synthase
MTSREIGRIARVLVRFGIRYIKLTGGEPMLRADIIEILDELKAAGVEEISMTTNATRFVELAHDLREHGLDRVNISIHSMRRGRYLLITGVDKLDYTMKAIETAVDVGLRPVKLNMVVLKGVNEDELDEIIEYSYSLGGAETNTVQFIELLNIDGRFYNAYHVDLSSIEEKIRENSVEIRYRRLHNRPVYLLENGVAVEFVKPMHNHAFCMGNDRIRITYDGKFKPCLMRSDNHVDFLGAMRSGASDEELARLYLKAILLREPFYKDDKMEEMEAPITDTCVV